MHDLITDLIQRSTALLPRSYSPIVSRLGLPALYSPTICLLNSSVKRLGCFGFLMSPSRPSLDCPI